MFKDIDAALIEAADPSTSPERLGQLNCWMNPEEGKRLRATLASNPNIETSLLWELAREYPLQVVNNEQFKLLCLSAEPWWEDCESLALIQLLSMDKQVSGSARTHLARLIWDEMTWDLGINLESYQSEVATFSCDLPATRQGLVDLLGFIGIFEATEGSSLEIQDWDDSVSGTAMLISKMPKGRDGLASWEIRVEFERVAIQMCIVHENARYSCRLFKLERCDSSLAKELFYEDDLSGFTSAEDQVFVETEVIQYLLDSISRPVFSVTLACSIDEINADLRERGDQAGDSRDIDPAQLIEVLKGLGIENGGSVDLFAISDCFDYEIGSIPGGQGYWGIEAVDPSRSCWNLDVDLDGFGAGTITATGPSGYVYQDDVHEPGQDEQYRNPTLASSLEDRICEGRFSSGELLRILSEALLQPG